MSAATIDFSKYEQAAPAGGGQIDFSKYETAEPTQTAGPETDRGEIPLTSHWAATEQGLNRVAEGAQHAVKGAYDTIAHPIDTAKRLIAAPGEMMRQIGQVPGAIRDINASEDPTGTYLNVAGRTAGEGGGQALAAIAAKKIGEGIGKTGAAIARNPRAIATAPVRLGARATEAAANQKLVPLKPLLNIMSPADDAEAAQFKVPGRDVGLTKPVFSKTRLGPEEAPPGPPPVFSKTSLGPESPGDEALAYNKIRAQGLRPGGLRQGPASAPASQTGEALGRIPAAAEPTVQLGPDAPPAEVIKARGLGGYVAPEPAAAGLGKIPVAAPEQPFNFPPEEPSGPLETQIPRAPVTENPVVGSFVRAMQKSGLPIAERPNLLLKGSGRVNRILGPDEELTGPLEKSLRQAKRQKEE